MKEVGDEWRGERHHVRVGGMQEKLEWRVGRLKVNYETEEKRGWQ